MHKQLMLSALTALWLLLGNKIAQAQVTGNAVPSCQDLARKAYNDVDEIRQLQLINDLQTRLYRYNDKIGSQYIGSELIGDGRLLTQKGWKKFSYLCLLESEQKALYFRILTR